MHSMFIEIWISKIPQNLDQRQSHSTTSDNLNKSENFMTTVASKFIPKSEAQNLHQLKPSFQTKNYLVKVPLNVNIVIQDLLYTNSFCKFYEGRSERGDFNWCRFLASCVCTLMMLKYRIVVSTSPSCFEAHACLFRMLMQGIFDPYVYVLWPFDKKLIS